MTTLLPKEISPISATLASGNAVFHVESELPTVLQLLSAALPDPPGGGFLHRNLFRIEIKISAHAEGGHLYSLSVNGKNYARHATVENLSRVLLSVVCDCLLRRSDEKPLIHAGAVSRNGVGILIPGTTFAGKSTTSTLLSCAGFNHHSDDACSVDERLRLSGVAKPILLRNGGWDVLRRNFASKISPALIWGNESFDAWYLNPTCLRSSEDHQAPIARLILFPYIDENGPVLVPVPHEETFDLLLQNMLTLGGNPGEAISNLRSLTNRCSGFRLNVSNPQQAIAAAHGAVDRIN